MPRGLTADYGSMSNPFLEDYREACRSVSEEFRRNKKLHGGRIHCRPGCTDCCHHLFQISEIEAAEISRFVRQLPAPERSRLEDRARPYREARDALMRSHGFIDARGRLPSQETRLACPALHDGRCSLYGHRPLICRKYGMPLVDSREARRVFACELNFRPGEHINDLQLVEIQTGLSENWSKVQRDYDHAGGRRHDLPISVADAILEDFEDYLPQ
jgi:Fe-S-cluster containining protein